MLLAALLADACDDRALDAADDVGAVVELLDHSDHGLNLRLGGVAFITTITVLSNPPFAARLSRATCRRSATL